MCPQIEIQITPFGGKHKKGEEEEQEFIISQMLTMEGNWCFLSTKLWLASFSASSAEEFPSESAKRDDGENRAVSIAFCYWVFFKGNWGFEGFLPCREQAPNMLRMRSSYSQSSPTPSPPALEFIYFF